MMSVSASRNHTGSVALAVAASLFCAFPLARPWFVLAPQSRDALATASPAITSAAWLGAHLALIAAFAALIVGLFGLYEWLAVQHPASAPRLSLILSMIGVALILPMAGVEAFALPPIGTAYLEGVEGLAKSFSSIYLGPGTVTLLAGLLALALGAVGFARALRNWAGSLLAVGLALWCPLLPAPVRILDGFLIGIGGICVAWQMWRGRHDVASLARS
jgi:hypothetical protein